MKSRVHRTRHMAKIIRQAERLRSQGLSYRLIGEKLGDVAKSTLSYWLSKKYTHIFDKTKQLEHLKNIRGLSKMALRKRGEKRNKEIRSDISTQIKQININNIGLQKIALSMLYWAEGTKGERVSGLIFTNTDPMLMSLFAKLLEHAYKIDKARFKVRLHLHYYHKISETRLFWQNLLKIRKEQFAAVYIKKRSRKKRFRQNFYGICFLNYPGSAGSRVRREMLEIGRQFAAKLNIKNSYRKSHSPC